MTIQPTTSLGGKSPADAIRDALAAARDGRLQEACAIAEQALSAGGDQAAINALLGMVRLDLGEYDAAVQHLEIAHGLRPSDKRVATDLANGLIAQERYDRALEIVSRELAFADPTLQLARIRGAIAVQLRDVQAATEALEYVLTASPHDWESWNNLGNALSIAEDFESSADAFEQALSINPRSPETRMNYAATLRELGRMEEAEALLRMLSQEFPNNPVLLSALHQLLELIGRDEEALEVIEQAINLAPKSLDLLSDKANNLANLQRMYEAEAVYQKILAIDPSNTAALVGIALMHELTNRTDNLARLADEAEQRGAGDAAGFIRAFHFLRSKQFDEGLLALELAPQDLEIERRLHLRGQLLEGVRRYDEAFKTFEEMNALYRESRREPEKRGATYRETIRNFHAAATSEWAQRWRPEESRDPRPSPVFLVGFPRSGTTLLDTMLMSHPQIEILEEEGTVRAAMDMLPSFADLPILPDEQIKAARDRYFDAVAKVRAIAPDKLLVDKNPLTMNLLPFVRRLFPDARIILALRHPCDVVLSCFMANFRLNEGMSSFVRLDTAAELYDLSFSYYEHVQSLMPLPTHAVVYENVVADRETELRALFGFLGLDWHEAVMEHEKTAQKRGRIKTASYSQVVEPIYTRASGRWQNYRKHLEPVMPVLEPWIRKLGYSAES